MIDHSRISIVGPEKRILVVLSMAEVPAGGHQKAVQTILLTYYWCWCWCWYWYWLVKDKRRQNQIVRNVASGVAKNFGASNQRNEIIHTRKSPTFVTNALSAVWVISFSFVSGSTESLFEVTISSARRIASAQPGKCGIDPINVVVRGSGVLNVLIPFGRYAVLVRGDGLEVGSLTCNPIVPKGLTGGQSST